MDKTKIGLFREVYVGAFMVAIGVLGVIWRVFWDFPSLIILVAGMYILVSELVNRVYSRGFEYYFPSLYGILFKESLFDLAFNQNHITRFLRMMSRFGALAVFRDLSDKDTRELLDGIDDTFIHRLFSPGILSMVKPSDTSFPIDRNVALSIIKERRSNPFLRPDMPYPVGITANRILLPKLAPYVGGASLTLSTILWKYYHKSSTIALIPAASGTLLSLIMLLRSRISSPPTFEKHFPNFPFRSLLLTVHPAACALICKYRH